MGVKIETDFESVDEDFNRVRKVCRAFSEITEKYRNFYTTIFLNRENRKIALKFSGGEIRSAKISKLDESED